MIEFGAPVLDLRLRFQGHALMTLREDWRAEGRPAGWHHRPHAGHPVAAGS
jgi:hypothetical protein